MADIAARLHHGTSRELPAERQPRDGQLEAPAVATFHHRDRSLLRLVHANARSRRVTQHCELQFQNDYEVNARQSLIWGGSFFSTGDDLAVDADIIPYRRRNTVESGFAQYGIALAPDRLRIIAGSKFEHSQYTGFEYQPQVRAVWTPIHSNSV